MLLLAASLLPVTLAAPPGAETGAGAGGGPCGFGRAVAHSAVLRVAAPTGVRHLKIKGAPAAELFEALSAGERRGVRPCHQKRLGRDYVGSTTNVVDPVVLELRWDDSAAPLPATLDLYHSLERNRVFGDAAYTGGELVVSGPAGRALAALNGHPEHGRVVLTIADASVGSVASVHTEP